MDERLLRQLTRQLRLLNLYIIFVSVVGLAGFIVMGVLMYKVLSFTRSVTGGVTDLKTSASEKLDPNQACDNDSRLGSYLRDRTDLCNGR